MELITFACDDVRYKRKDRPEVWISPSEVNGQMFVGYPYVSFIPGSNGEEKPLQVGRFVIDIDTQEIACQDAIKIISWFQGIYGVEPEQWSILLSGKKGVHLELSQDILGTEDGHQFLMLAYKRLAKDVEGELNINLDTSMYTTGVPKPYRQPNVMRDTGTCKRQIEYDDLFAITTEEEYRIACNAPGPLWEPEDTERNDTLARKIEYYLSESEAQQEAIKRTPQLSDDDLDRLAIDIPPCIKVLAGARTAIKGNTFNDIAIQLTAYAVTTKRTEAEFLAGCMPFIESYPSSSLNTIDKRLENCRARYRTMAANGNQHSCGGILALRAPGFDCSECTAGCDKPGMTVEVMSDEEVAESNLSLRISPDILDPGGLISLGMQGLSSPGMVDIPQYNLAVVLTNLANAVAGKLTCMGTWPNLYNIKVGRTSTGKTSSDKAMVKAVESVGIPGFYGPTDFASGPGLIRALVNSPVMMIVIDECTNMFKRYEGKGDPIGDGKRDALLEAYSACGGRLHKVYADAKNSIVVENPCLSITGNATTTIFDAIKQEDFDTGTMQRFDFFSYDGPAPKRGLKAAEQSEALIRFAEGLYKIRDARPPEGNLCGLVGSRFAPFALELTDAATKVLGAWSDEVTELSNAAGSDGDRGIIGRQFDLAIKYALVHLAASRPVEALFMPMEAVDIEYGKRVAWMLGNWKLNILRDRVTTGEFHQRCEIFKQAQAAAQRTGQRPTFKLMANRRKAMLNWKRKESEEIISMLVNRGEIVVDNSKKPTAYYRPKLGKSDDA